MNSEAHRKMTADGLADRFSPQDLETIVQANQNQDRLSNLIGHPEIHFDDSAFEAGQRYIDLQRQEAADAVVRLKDRRAALQAFGRLLHGRQDFYAHSNWVMLWTDQHGGWENCSPEDIEICADPLNVPGLISGTGSPWHFIGVRIPLFGSLIRRHLIPADSHEIMNLDGPGQGPLFDFAVAAATKHTSVELEYLLRDLKIAGGQATVDFFSGGDFQ
ncbi:MAG: hypothetical protein U9R25_07790 [Chloroflexota bacterium]|nr:hypothetical protein [Chloroflexota bacterium]